MLLACVSKEVEKFTAPDLRLKLLVNLDRGIQMHRNAQV